MYKIKTPNEELQKIPVKGHKIQPAEPEVLNVAICWSDERSDIVRLPREEPLTINWSSLKDKHVTDPECILKKNTTDNTDKQL